MPPSKEDRNTRARNNQRLSRARKVEYITSLEDRLRQFERGEVAATSEIQTRARAVDAENRTLRRLLCRALALDDLALGDLLNTGGEPTIEKLLSQRFSAEQGNNDGQGNGFIAQMPNQLRTDLSWLGMAHQPYQTGLTPMQHPPHHPQQQPARPPVPAADWNWGIAANDNTHSSPTWSHPSQRPPLQETTASRAASHSTPGTAYDEPLAAAANAAACTTAARACDDLGPTARRFCDLLTLVTSAHARSNGGSTATAGKGLPMDCRSAYAYLHDLLQGRRITVEDAVARLMDSSRIVQGQLHVDEDIVRQLLAEAGLDDVTGPALASGPQPSGATGQGQYAPAGCCGPNGPTCV